MKKYFLVAKNTWDEMLTYRMNFVMYRIRNVFSFLTIYFLWLALLPGHTMLFGYSQQAMLTYIIGTAILTAFVMSSQSYLIGDDINQGNLSNYLIRPLDYFYYWAAKDMGDKAMNIVFAITELTILYFILRPPFFIQTNGLVLLLFLSSLIIAMILYFLFNLVIGMFAFWSPEVWAPRFIFMIVLSFFAGNYFPLDILPDPLYRIFSFLPFQYLLYFPLKIYLQQLSFEQMYSGLALSLFWCVLLYGFVQWFWRKGLQNYTAQGN